MNQSPRLSGCWSMLLLALFIGCVPSLNPLYTDANLVFEPALLGVWKQPEGSARWEFSKLDTKSYRLLYTDEKGQQGRFIGYLARLEGELFLDLFPEGSEMDASGFYKFHLVPIHTIYRVRGTQPKLELAAIDFKWLDEYLTSHPQEIECATFNGRKLITAPTPAVQKFVLAHKDQFTSDFPLQKLEGRN
jgi:hypothetical protein